MAERGAEPAPPCYLSVVNVTDDGEDGGDSKVDVAWRGLAAERKLCAGAPLHHKLGD